MNAVLTPASEAQIAEIIVKAKTDKTALEIVGGGTRLGLGRPVQAAKTLSLSALSGISFYEPGALTLVAKAGTPLAQIERALTKEGQRLPFEPMDHRALLGSKGEPTIGAMVAANISGPRRIQAGACRDALLGVRFVNGNGEIIKSGGRVMKNVTGLDLVKLLAGSYGTLGALSEVSFKVLPINEREATLAIEGLSLEQAIGVLSAALTSPFEVTGAAYLPQCERASQTLLRVEGFASQLDYRLERLRETVAAGFDVSVIKGKAHDALWRSVRDVEIFECTDHCVWKLSVKPGDAPAIAKVISDRIDATMLFDWGGGLIWAGVNDQKTAGAEIIRSIVGQYGGHATLVRAPDALRLAISPFQPQTGRIKELSAAIRQKFDPDGILNPGRMSA